MSDAKQQWLPIIVHPETVHGQTYKEAFKRFDKMNPHVFRLLRDEAIAIKRAAPGLKHIGIDFLFARLRWFYLMHTGGDTFKMNNNYQPFYNRKLMDECFELAGFFNTRRQRSKDKIMKVVSNEDRYGGNL